VLQRRTTILQAALNQPASSLIFRQAEALATTLGRTQDLLTFDWINKPLSIDPCLHTFSSHEGSISACAISPDESLAVSTSSDMRLIVWCLVWLHPDPSEIICRF